MNKEFIRALDEIQKEKGIDKAIILDSIEKALVKSFEKNFEENSNVEIKINEVNGDVNVYAVKDIVEEVENPYIQISLKDAQEIRKSAKLGSAIKIKIAPKNFGRVAAQTARNIVIQQIRDAERDAIYKDYIDKERELITGEVQRIDFNNVYIDLGKTEGFIPPSEQVPGEKLSHGDRVKLFVSEVKSTSKGPQIILSRASSDLIKRLFELEVPEINDGTVEIVSIAREAGFRTKIAVAAKTSDVDALGACVGLKGMRVNSIVDEINGEKIDVIIYDEDPKVYISNSLSPAEVKSIVIDEKGKSALAIVPDNQLSLAIGKEGQNVRLAAKLTNWKIDIKGESSKDQAIKDFDAKVEERKFKEIKESEKEESENKLLIEDLKDSMLNNEIYEEDDYSSFDADNSEESDLDISDNDEK